MCSTSSRKVIWKWEKRLFFFPLRVNGATPPPLDNRAPRKNKTKHKTTPNERATEYPAWCSTDGPWYTYSYLPTVVRGDTTAPYYYYYLKVRKIYRTQVTNEREHERLFFCCIFSHEKKAIIQQLRPPPEIITKNNPAIVPHGHPATPLSYHHRYVLRVSIFTVSTTYTDLL